MPRIKRIDTLGGPIWQAGWVRWLRRPPRRLSQAGRAPFYTTSLPRKADHVNGELVSSDLAEGRGKRRGRIVQADGAGFPSDASAHRSSRAFSATYPPSAVAAQKPRTTIEPEMLQHAIRPLVSVTPRKLALFVQIRIAAPHTAARAKPRACPPKIGFVCSVSPSLRPPAPQIPPAPPPLDESNFAFGHPANYPAQIGFVCSNSHRRAPHRRSGESRACPPKLALFAPFLLHFAYPPRKSLRTPAAGGIQFCFRSPSQLPRANWLCLFKFASPHPTPPLGRSPEPAPQNWLCSLRFAFASPIRPANPSAPPPLADETNPISPFGRPADQPLSLMAPKGHAIAQRLRYHDPRQI